MPPNKPGKAYHAALRQIETNIRKRMQRKLLIISAADIDAEVKRLTLVTYREAKNLSAQCADPAKRGQFFSNAGVDADTVRQILQSAAP